MFTKEDLVFFKLVNTFLNRLIIYFEENLPSDSSSEKREFLENLKKIKAIFLVYFKNLPEANNPLFNAYLTDLNELTTTFFNWLNFTPFSFSRKQPNKKIRKIFNDFNILSSDQQQSLLKKQNQSLNKIYDSALAVYENYFTEKLGVNIFYISPKADFISIALKDPNFPKNKNKFVACLSGDFIKSKLMIKKLLERQKAKVTIADHLLAIYRLNYKSKPVTKENLIKFLKTFMHKNMKIPKDFQLDIKSLRKSIIDNFDIDSLAASCITRETASSKLSEKAAELFLKEDIKSTDFPLLQLKELKPSLLKNVLQLLAGEKIKDTLNQQIYNCYQQQLLINDPPAQTSSNSGKRFNFWKDRSNQFPFWPKSKLKKDSCDDELISLLEDMNYGRR